MKISGSKMAPPQGVLGLNHRNTKKNIQNLLQNHLLQVHEIWYVAFLSVPLSCLFNESFRFLNAPAPGGSGFEP